MSVTNTCPACGAALPDGVSAKQCPACLLRAGMEAETVPSGMDEYSDGITVAGTSSPLSLQSTIAAPREAPGTMIGRYKLLQEIGEGGFGIVYLAEQQEPVKRKVALKVLKPGMDTREVVARFEAERQALALMDHPNIAKVFDGGATESGRPYFVMELVKGFPLTKYCDDHQLTTRQRLDLFLDVLAAVQHAHQKGIIHRDLKPSNILVSRGVDFHSTSAAPGGLEVHATAGATDRPVVKVIDFGIAKAVSMELTSRTLFTGVGTMIGTPQYMSPEQAEVNALDVDTRSDLYSLGVVLYELLTGRTPLDSKKLREAGYAEIQRLIREETPAKPSTLLKQILTASAPTASSPQSRISNPKSKIPTDLDWIVMKALEKDRTRRYETANAFAADIHRHLNNEPVTARAPGTAYLLGKFIRRHRAAFAAGTAVALALILGILGVTLGFIRERQAREMTQARLKQVVKANEILASVFTSIDPQTEQAKGKPLRAILSEQLAAATAEIEGDAIGDPLMVAGMQMRLGEAQLGLGNTDAAILLLRKALKTRETELGPEHLLSLISRRNIANVLYARGDFAQAEAEGRAALAAFQHAHGPEHPESLVCAHNLAITLHAAGNYAAAESLHRAMFDVRSRISGPEAPDTLRSRHDLANSVAARGEYVQAEAEFRAVYEMRKRVLGEGHRDTLLSRSNAANALEAQRKFAEAESEHRAILELREQSLWPGHPDALQSRGNLANALYAQGKYAEAGEEYRVVARALAQALTPEHPDTLKARSNLANTLAALGKSAEAETEHRAILDMRERTLPPDHPDTLNTCYNIAFALSKQDKTGDARAFAKRAVDGARRSLPPGHPHTEAYEAFLESLPGK